MSATGPGKYKDTVTLPETAFPMRGDLAKREPEILARWAAEDLYGAIQRDRAAAPTFILHDGPPYSNGHIHYGHILNKILKDLVVKHKTMLGFRAPYIPGWDTHGLPIELAVERELGPKRREMSQAQVRQACRDYALRFVDIQRTEFQRLGVFGDWANPYLTLSPVYEQRERVTTTPPKITGYIASNVVRVELRDVTAVGGLIDAATAAGANRADDLQFTLEERGPAHSQALERAGADALRQAQAAAKALNVEIGRVLNATVGGGPIVYPKTYGRGMVAMAESSAPPPVEAGDVDVSASLQVTYEIK